MKPSRYAHEHSTARLFVGQLEPYVTEVDLFPVFGSFGRVLHLNVVRHSTTVTPNEERRIPTAFIWYEKTEEADAAIAALHNKFSFSLDDDESRRRYIQVSYADKSPQTTPYGQWQKRRAEVSRRTPNANMKKVPSTGNGWSVSAGMSPSPSTEDLARQAMMQMQTMTMQQQLNMAS